MRCRCRSCILAHVIMRYVYPAAVSVGFLALIVVGTALVLLGA